MNKKTLLIIIGAIVVLLGLIFLAVSGNFSTTDSEPPLVTTLDPQAIPPEPTILIPAITGTVETANFLKTAAKVTDVRAELISNPDLGLAYSPITSTFHATISAADSSEFSKKRAEIENYFLSKLNISQEEACRLRVIIRTLPAPDESISDKTFPLSFCSAL